MPCTNCSRSTTISKWVTANCVVKKTNTSCERCIERGITKNCKFKCTNCKDLRLSCSGNPSTSCSNCQGSRNRPAVQCIFEGVQIVDSYSMPREVTAPPMQTKFRLKPTNTTYASQQERKRQVMPSVITQDLPLSSGSQSTKRPPSRSPPSASNTKRVRHNSTGTYGMHPSGSKSMTQLPNIPPMRTSYAPAHGFQTFQSAALPPPQIFTSNQGGYAFQGQNQVPMRPVTPRFSNHRGSSSGSGGNRFNVTSPQPQSTVASPKQMALPPKHRRETRSCKQCKKFMLICDIAHTNPCTSCSNAGVPCVETETSNSLPPQSGSYYLKHQGQGPPSAGGSSRHRSFSYYA